MSDKKKPRKSEMRMDLFAREYVIDFNGTRAYIAAGYSPNGADASASQLLGNPRVQKKINQLLANRYSRLDIKADKIIEEIGRLAFSNMMDYIKTTGDGDFFVDFSTLTRDQSAAIQEVTSEVYMEGKGEEAREVKRTKFKLVDKTKNLELLGRYLKLFAEDKAPNTVNVFMLSEKDRLTAQNVIQRLLPAKPEIEVEPREIN